MKLRIKKPLVKKTSNDGVADPGQSKKMMADRCASGDELPLSEDWFHDIIERASEMIQSVDPDGRYLYVNQAWLDTMGYSRKEITALHALDVISPSSRARSLSE